LASQADRLEQRLYPLTNVSVIINDKDGRRLYCNSTHGPLTQPRSMLKDTCAVQADLSSLSAHKLRFCIDCHTMVCSAPRAESESAACLWERKEATNLSGLCGQFHTSTSPVSAQIEIVAKLRRSARQSERAHLDREASRLACKGRPSIRCWSRWSANSHLVGTFTMHIIISLQPGFLRREHCSP
jgi:hypothetical protein